MTFDQAWFPPSFSVQHYETHSGSELAGSGSFDICSIRARMFSGQFTLVKPFVHIQVVTLVRMSLVRRYTSTNVIAKSLH